MKPKESRKKNVPRETAAKVCVFHVKRVVCLNAPLNRIRTDRFTWNGGAKAEGGKPIADFSAFRFPLSAFERLFERIKYQSTEQLRIEIGALGGHAFGGVRDRPNVI